MTIIYLINYSTRSVINQKKGGIMGINLKNATSFIILPLLMRLTGISMSAGEDVPIITKEELKAQLDSSDVMILDVRKGNDRFQVQGSRFRDCDTLVTLMSQHDTRIGHFQPLDVSASVRPMDAKPLQDAPIRTFQPGTLNAEPLNPGNIQLNQFIK